MKKTKQRVIAIDYFRGVCILAVLLNHSQVFSLPFSYLSGAGRLWTSAAEMFFLLSGITFGIIRGGQVLTDFKTVLRKSWHRAAFTYCLYVATVFASLAFALILLSHNISGYFPGELPTGNILHTFVGIITLSYAFGWASFLMFYAVFLAIAPFLAYILHTRYWVLVSFTSLLIYVLNSAHALPTGRYYWFAVWQAYFVIGLVIARFRIPALSWFYGLGRDTVNKISATVFGLSGLAVLLSVLVEFNAYPIVERLTKEGWVPTIVERAYSYLLDYKPSIDGLLMQARSGLLRPVAATLVLLAVYLLYQRYKVFLLSRTGNFINSLGQNTLWIFVAQAMVIPAMALLPVPRNLADNFIMTSTLISLMWLVTKRNIALGKIREYGLRLAAQLTKIKYSYDYKPENSA